MPRGGKRPGAGRPSTSPTPRTPVTLRLPLHLVNAAHRRAEVEGITVTRWIEIAIERRLKN
jgi:predicted DNA binding CopG/RHH family protein